MKQILSITIFVAICFNFNMAYSQSTDTIVITESMFSSDRPDVDTVLRSEYGYIKLEMDVLFLTNKLFLDEYQQCIADYNTLRETCDKALETEEMIKLIEVEFDTLRVNLVNIENAYQKSLDGNIQTIDLLRTDNARLKQNLENAQNNLNKAQALIKQERWNSLGSKLIWGVGGTAVGVLFSGLIIAAAN